MSERLPEVFIVGAGRVATALAGAWRLAGVPVLGLWSRRPAAVHAAAGASGVPGYAAAPPEVLATADVVVVAVRDEAIGEVAAMLVDTGLVTSQQVLLHCAGSLSAAAAFRPVGDRVSGIGTLHPLRAIADGGDAMRDLAGTMFGIEGDDRGRAVARQLVVSLDGLPLTIATGSMTAYHAAAVMAANYVVALVDAAAELLQQAGIDPDTAVAALLPLVQGSLANIGAHGTVAGLSGPIRRGDEDTVARHLQMLGDSSRAELYRVLGRRTLALARRAGDAPRGQLDAIAKLLA